MGSAHTKDNSSNNATLQTPIRKDKKKLTAYAVSPVLARAMAASFTDPRSPGSRRTPVGSPASTPPLTRKPYRERMLERMPNAKFDPRSPSVQRTPLHLITSDVSVRKAPPSPFTLGDPRSPYTMRTPLALSAQDAIVVPDDISVEAEVIVAEVIVEQSTSKSTATSAEKDEELKEAPVVSSSAAESTSTGFITEKFSPDVSPSIVALASSPMFSPMYSPVLGRRRKELIKGASPLKKSYSAPDENASPSSLCKSDSLSMASKPRTPLSPLSVRTNNVNSRHSLCMAVQPIKFRMDPGILG